MAWNKEFREFLQEFAGVQCVNKDKDGAEE